MGSGKGVEHQEFLPIFLQTRRGFGIFHSIGIEEPLERPFGGSFGRGAPDVL